MNHQTIILLEDDADRVRGFESAVVQLGPSYRLRASRDAHRMIAECDEVLADAPFAISLPTTSAALR